MDEFIQEAGVRYRFFAGPYADQIDAYDRIAALIEYGTLNEQADDPIVIGSSIYIRVRETAAAD
jgi:hypothetical protein